MNSLADDDPSTRRSARLVEATRFHTVRRAAPPGVGGWLRLRFGARRGGGGRGLAPAPARLRPLRRVLDRAERIRDPMLATVAHEQHARVVERCLATGAAVERRVEPARLLELAGLPPRPLDRPGHDVLEPAEPRPPRARGLSQAKSVLPLHGSPAPAAPLFARHSPWVESSRRWRTRKLSCSRGTRPGRSCSIRPSVCSTQGSPRWRSSSSTTTSRS